MELELLRMHETMKIAQNQQFNLQVCKMHKPVKYEKKADDSFFPIGPDVIFYRVRVSKTHRTFASILRFSAIIFD